MYTQEITRKHRAAFVLVLDQSTSMQQQVQFGRLTATKAEVVAYTANALITKFNYEERGMKVWLIKPAIDTRDGADVVRSFV